MELKLNNKRTFIVGFAFFTILMLWQVYNYYCPLFLENLLQQVKGDGDYHYIIGLIMALDNILALFMLPIFGSLSDKTKTKFGKRMPYIIVGTIISLLAFPFIPFLFIKNSLVGVIVMMAIILIAMNIYRAPSVALMPDMTPKPLRSKANAIINFVGYIGAIIGSVLTMVFTMKNPNSLIWPFIIVSVFMVVALVVLVLKIKENKIIASMKDKMELGEKLSETNEAIVENKPLGKLDKQNLILLIASVFLWYFAFNAVETFGSIYGTEVLKTQSWGMLTAILAVSSLITFLPSIYIANKLGRKGSIILGLGAMILALVVGAFIKTFNFWLILMFVIAGFGWAIINVNSYPMLVELASNKNIGKFTGAYYSASQIAQSITPILIGFVFDKIGLQAYFPYAAIFMFIALLVFMFVKVPKKKVLENGSNENETEEANLNNDEDKEVTKLEIENNASQEIGKKVKNKKVNENSVSEKTSAVKNVENKE